MGLETMKEALDIQVTGVVQGVGFRPFVYRLAKKYLICGWVLNAVEGVYIHAEGQEQHLDEFVLEIAENAPAAAQVQELELKEVPLENFENFEIRFSTEKSAEKTTLISPDLATCADCARELFDDSNRRYRYPFINCTNCGPRFTIINALPYDRKNTSMRNFYLCEACQKEYDDPLDRRFHAQPDACFECGPHVAWHDLSTKEVLKGNTLEASDNIIKAAVDFLHAGKIVAVKGLGGFHLVCDAHNAEALAELRRRKHRKGQAFAVMVENIMQARQYCHINAEEEKLLESAQRPIVLCKKRTDAKFALGLADDLGELGIMLPYTPIQHLIVHDFGGMLVMTSANIHDEPIVIDDDEEAHRVLSELADAFLSHNRDIVARYDDSVMRVIQSGENEYAIQCLRRARSYAPMPLALPDILKVFSAEQKTPSIFAAGSEQKNTFCFTRGKEVFVSQHIGDMENAETFDSWLEAKNRYERLFEIQADILARDMHPEYISSKWATEQDKQCISVQHHHAHIISVMAENSLSAPVAGFAFDGTGYGVDGKIWGGELLLCNYQTFERFANFAYVPMPGGAAAIKHPERMAYGALWAFDLLEHPQAKKFVQEMGKIAQLCEHMIEQGVNTPHTSSLGRLFDAASALLGLCRKPRYEGEGAILLEAAIDYSLESSEDDTKYQIELTKNMATSTSTAQDTSILLVDAAPAFKSLLDDVDKGVSVGIIARRFHDALVQVVVDLSQAVRAMYEIETIALSGGVFMNRYLLESIFEALMHEGFTLAINRDLPPNDGCISFGQAVVALALNDE